MKKNIYINSFKAKNEEQKIRRVNMEIRLGRTSCSSSSSRSSLGSFLRMNAVHETEGELSQEHAELDDDIDKESRCRSRRSLSRPLWLWSPGLNLISSKQSVSLSSDDVVTYITTITSEKRKKRHWHVVPDTFESEWNSKSDLEKFFYY